MQKALQLCRRSGNRQAECWALFGTGDMLLRLGRPAEAVSYYDEGLAKIDERTTTADTIWGMGMRALASLRSGDHAGAFAFARRALAHILSTQPLGYWMQHGTAATAEVFLVLLESDMVPPGDARGAGAVRSPIHGQSAPLRAPLSGRAPARLSLERTQRPPDGKERASPSSVAPYHRQRQGIWDPL